MQVIIIPEEYFTLLNSNKTAFGTKLVIDVKTRQWEANEEKLLLKKEKSIP